jgi:Ca-activated chloride channel family protein
MTRFLICVCVVTLTAREPVQERPTFSAQSELVVMHVSVKDSRGALVQGLPQDAFSVIEDGQPQAVTFFSPADAPATVGLLIDNSTSMIPRREMVIGSALAFTQHSNPDDEVFVLAFNENVEEIWPHKVIRDTNMVSLRAVLTGGISARGKTALYDALARGLEGLGQGRHTRQVLVVLSDGSDNASAGTLDAVLNKMQAADAAIFTVALRDPTDYRDGDPKLLRRIAVSTGGEAFEPRQTREIPEVLEHIARDIRAAYTIGYAPANPNRDGKLRKLRVVVRSPDGRPLTIRSRTGYLAATSSDHAPKPTSLKYSHGW